MTTEATILDIARAVRSDAWVDYASRGGFSVGFADNREPSTYNAAAHAAAVQLRAHGFKVTLRAGDEHHACAIIRVRA